MWPKLTGTGAIDACLVAAGDEAWRFGERRIGTEHLLLGLLHDVQTAAPLGTTLEQGRAALAELDFEALDAIGLKVRGLDSPQPPSTRKRPALVRNQASAGFRSVMTRAVADNGGKIRGLKPPHLLRSMLAAQPPEPGAALLARLAVDPTAVRARLDAAGTAA